MIIDLAAQDETSRVLDNLASVADDVAPKRIGIEDMEPGKYLVFGSMFILGLNSALFPLDTLTTIVMAEGRPPSKSLFHLARSIARREGIPRFWRGLGASVVGTFPGQAAYYLGYETAQSYTSKHWDAVKDTPYTTFLKGFISGIASLSFLISAIHRSNFGQWMGRFAYVCQASTDFSM